MTGCLQQGESSVEGEQSIDLLVLSLCISYSLINEEALKSALFSEIRDHNSERISQVST